MARRLGGARAHTHTSAPTLFILPPPPGFYLSRIGIRMLIGQHLALHEPAPRENHIGARGGLRARAGGARVQGGGGAPLNLLSSLWRLPSPTPIHLTRRPD